MKTEILVTTISEIPTETETSTTNDKIDKYLELVGGKRNSTIIWQFAPPLPEAESLKLKRLRYSQQSYVQYFV